MGQGQGPRGLLCPGCGTSLEPLGEGEGAPGECHRMKCRHCGETFRARRRETSPGDEHEREPVAAGAAAVPPPAGSFSLWWRGAALRGVELVYRAGVMAGSTTLLACGGFVPVVSAWLRDEINDWGGVLETLGGVHVVTQTRDPDADLGPVLAFTDAPLLFSAVNEVARRLGVKSPGQIRLTYLPCCGVVAWGQSQALILGLPLLRVLTQAELRAIIAHELAHLAKGDATRAAKSARGLSRGLNQAARPRRGSRARTRSASGPAAAHALPTP